MIILKEGECPKQRTFEGQCKRCKSVIRASEKEVVVESGGWFWDDWAHQNCPICHKDGYLHGINFHLVKESNG